MSDYKIHYDWESYPYFRITEDLLINSATITIDTDPGNPPNAYDVLVRDIVTGIVRQVDPGDLGGGGGTVTADNGLIISTGSNVQLGNTSAPGAPLLHNTYVNNDTFSLNFTGAVSTYVLHSTNTGFGYAIQGTSSSAITGIGVGGFSTAGAGVHGQSTNSYGVRAISSTSFALSAESNWASTNDIQVMASFNRTSSGTALTGLGGKLDISLENSAGTPVTSNELASYWTDISAITSEFKITGRTANTVVDRIYFGGASIRANAIRFEEYKGANVAAANDLTLGTDGNLFTITGNTQINAITTANWQAGSTIGFVFTGTPTLKHNTAGGAGTATMLLAGAVDFTAAATDYIEFRYDGTNWHEITRKLAAGVATVTADNGLSKNTSTNVQLGSATAPGAPLLHDTYIDAGTDYVLYLTGSNGDANEGVFRVDNTSTVGGPAKIAILATSLGVGGNGYAVYGNGTYTGIRGVSTNIGVLGSGTYGVQGDGTSIGIYGTATNAGNSIGVRGSKSGGGGGYGGLFENSAGNAMLVSATGGFAANFVRATSSNVVETVVKIACGKSSGAGAAGLGALIEFNIDSTTAGLSNPSNQIQSEWTDATNGSQTSKFSIVGSYNGSLYTALTISGSGIFTLTQGLTDYADDSAAAAGGIGINQLYRTGSIIKIRVS